MDLLILGLFLFLASISDLKTREVPDWLSFSLIAFGVFSSVVSSLISSSWLPFLASLLGFILCFVIGIVMFYSGQWGGGDSKLIMGVGSVLGLTWPSFPVLVSFLVTSLLVGALYGLFYGLFLVVRHWRLFKRAFVGFIHLPRVVALRRLILIVALFLLVLSFWLPYPVRFLFWLLVGFVLAGYYLVLVMKVVERSCMVKEIPVGKLTEGDWIYKEVFVNKKCICGPKDLGVSLEQIALLKKLKKQNKVNKVTIKEGVPFVPSFFIAYLIVIWKGAWFLFLFF